MRNRNKYVLIDNNNRRNQGHYETLDALKEDLKEPEDDVLVMSHENFDKFNKDSFKNGREEGFLGGYILSIAGACVFQCARVIINSIRNKHKK